VRGVALENFHASSKITTTQDCNPEDFVWGILILSRHPPYRLYEIVGEPDSDTAVEYERLRLEKGLIDAIRHLRSGDPNRGSIRDLSTVDPL